MEDNHPALAISLLREMAQTVQSLYRAAPDGAFKNGSQMYLALRAADKANAYLTDDLEALVTMEREDTAYWRQRYISSRDHLAIPVSPASEAQNEILSDSASSVTFNEYLQVGRAPPVEPATPIEVPPLVPQIVVVPSTPHLNMAFTSATPNLGPLLPSPIQTQLEQFDLDCEV